MDDLQANVAAASGRCLNGETPPSRESLAAAAQAAVGIADEVVDHLAKTDLAPAFEQIACKKGCAFCCTQMVGITLAEAIWLRDYLSALHPLKRGHIRDRAIRALKRGQGLDQGQWNAAQITCPLVDKDQGCIAHEARPLPCRGFNSGDAAVCRSAAGKSGVPIPVLGIQLQAYAQAQMGLSQALATAGVTPAPMLLTAVLADLP